MNSLFSLINIEIILVISILVIQTLQGYSTYKNINLLKDMIPELNFIYIKKIKIPLKELISRDPKLILKNLEVYINKQTPILEYQTQELFDEGDVFSNELLIDSDDYSIDQEGDESLTDVSLIVHYKTFNPVFEEVITSINVYLLRNKGAATDFNLIKDIVERNIDAEEDDITQTATIPLYLGLMGTMIGIVFGLINLFLVSDGDNFEIQGFLGGVSVAMFASFYGLSWTVFNSSFGYKNARRKVEKSKNAFYTFIQTELLPVLNQSVSSSVHTLNSNLMNFNDKFSLNLNRLSSLFNKNYDALIAQERILSSLEKLDITEFAKANVTILKELKSGTDHLEGFNQYLGHLEHLVAGTTQLSQSFESVLSRANNFEELAQKLDSRVEESNKLVKFLNDHYSIIQDRGNLINSSVIKVEDIIIKSLGQLEEHTQVKLEAIKQMTIKEEDLLTKSFAENSSHISKLSLLADLNKNIIEIKTNSADEINKIKQEIGLMSDKIVGTNDLLNKINTGTFMYQIQSMSKYIKGFFSGKN